LSLAHHPPNIKLDDIQEAKPDVSDTEKRRSIIETNFTGTKFQIDDVARVLSEQMEGERHKSVNSARFEGIRGKGSFEAKGFMVSQSQKAPVVMSRCRDQRPTSCGIPEGLSVNSVPLDT